MCHITKRKQWENQFWWKPVQAGETIETMIGWGAGHHPGHRSHPYIPSKIISVFSSSFSLNISGFSSVVSKRSNIGPECNRTSHKPATNLTGQYSHHARLYTSLSQGRRQGVYTESSRHPRISFTACIKHKWKTQGPTEVFTPDGQI